MQNETKPQLQTIVEKLEKDGEVSRNWCLQNYITRLAGRILDLKSEGWEFETERRGKDYVYKAVVIPRKQLVLLDK